MKYLKITNNGTMSRKYLELIGATNKRDRMSDSSVIGNKGSGAKIAVVPMLRLGVQVAYASSDSIGSFILNYTTQTADLGGGRTVQQIVFDYGTEGSFPSQLTLDAFRDWDSPIGDDDKKVFKAFREYICNAYDEDKSFTMEQVDEITFAKEGQTSAYIQFTPEIEDIQKHMQQYFKFLGHVTPLYKDSYSGAIYPKSDSGKSRLFCQGVLVDCKSEKYYSSVYDYSLNDKWLLSEERVLKDYSQYLKALGSMIGDISDFTILLNLLAHMMNEKADVELSALQSLKKVPHHTASFFVTVWQMQFGKKALISCDNSQVDNDARNKGYHVVDSVPYQLKQFLKKCGIKDTSDVAPVVKEKEKLPYEVVKISTYQRGLFNQAYAKYLSFCEKAKEFPVYFFKATDYQLKNAQGFCGIQNRMYKEIWIAEKELYSVENILGILVHEGRHCITAAGDYERLFTQHADDELVQMIMGSNKTAWVAKVVPNRGILIPERFKGHTVEIVIFGDQILLRCNRIGETLTSVIKDATVSAKQIKPVSKVRTVTSFKKYGCVYLPNEMLTMYGTSVSFEVFNHRNNNSFSHLQ